MLLSASYRTMGLQDGSGPKGIKWNRFGPLADQLQTKQTNSINCTIAFKFYITKKLLMAHKNRNILIPKSCTGKSSYLKCIVLYLFPKIPYTGMYPMDVGIVNKLAH